MSLLRRNELQNQVSKMKLGLLGQSLQHSFSPAYFADKFLAEVVSANTYKAFEIAALDAKKLDDLILSERLDGFNVTIPYKEKILPFLHQLSEDATTIGAVNTVDVQWLTNKSYTLKGYNTDWTGFLKSIRPFLTLHHQKALILGTGGASKAIAYALKTLGIDMYYVTREAEKKGTNYLHYDELNQHAIRYFKLIINCTPLGTFPETENFPPIPYHFLSNEHLLCDLIYNPAETEFMKKGKAYGASVLNGLAMLQFQADEAWAIWKNKKGHSD